MAPCSLHSMLRNHWQQQGGVDRGGKDLRLRELFIDK
jgi:hypothetical protein